MSRDVQCEVWTEKSVAISIIHSVIINSGIVAKFQIMSHAGINSIKLFMITCFLVLGHNFSSSETSW